jgi:hypothetical protein
LSFAQQKSLVLSFCNIVDMLFYETFLQEAAEATIATLEVLPEPFKSMATTLVDICAYAGTGNVLKVQSLLHICSEHYDPAEKEDKKESGKKKDDKKAEEKKDDNATPGILFQPFVEKQKILRLETPAL